MDLSLNTQLAVSSFRAEQADALPLEDILRQAVAHNAVEISQQKSLVLKMANDPTYTSNPEMLSRIQEGASQYNLTVSLYSAMTRKAVNAIDTLIRA